jgi:hypothetical protein
MPCSIPEQLPLTAEIRAELEGFIARHQRAADAAAAAADHPDDSDEDHAHDAPAPGAPAPACADPAWVLFVCVIFHPNARGAPASDWDAAAEEHAAPERTSSTPSPTLVPYLRC